VCKIYIKKKHIRAYLGEYDTYTEYVKELIGGIETIHTCRSGFKYMHLCMVVDILGR